MGPSTTHKKPPGPGMTPPHGVTCGRGGLCELGIQRGLRAQG